jgi:EAL domain-containing protein (putative c-di-GMP-specific phosphodiesterase class I)/GGDEF domain-containing protein
MADHPATSPANRFRAERDRFVAMSFCWADILIECDGDERVVFAVGPTELATGLKASQLIGKSLQDLVAASDLSLVRGLLAIPRKSGRIENAAVRLASHGGQPKPLLFAGYKLDDLNGHYFLAFRSSPSAGAKHQPQAARDTETGLHDANAYANRIKNAVSKGEIGENSLMTLISLPGYEELRQRLDEDTERQLLDTLGTYLRANSLGGDMASRIDEGKYSLVHDASVNVNEVEKKISEFSKEADPTGKGVTAEAASLEVTKGDVSADDVASGLSYTLRMFQKSEKDEFDLDNLASSFSSLIDQTADRVREFRRLVAAAEFDVAFHPILHSMTGEIHHYEALVRFQKDEAGTSPFETITFAEEAGLIPEFDLAMANKVVRHLANIPDRFQAAVNISGHSVADEDYLAGLDALLQQNEWASERVIFEITESARMADLESANKFIQRLRKDGYEVCLDDFGAGAASFQYLSTLEVDVVKLDGSAIQNAQKATKGKAFLKALARFCHEVDVHTIAEMVDSPQGLEFVRECGVEFVQGFLFGKPNTDILSFGRMGKEVEALFRRTGGRAAYG